MNLGIDLVEIIIKMDSKIILEEEILGIMTVLRS
jgi:hypothetical protein